MIIEQKTEKAFLSLWFGNFYRPAYDDREFVRRAITLIKDLGFNTVLLDSKAWEDFALRFQGGEASPYVSMQEFMQEEILRQGLSYQFLSLYLNGDNLYPHIRFSPPIYGDSVVNADGSDGKWYRYWSPKAQDSMAEHVEGLLRLYGERQSRIGMTEKSAAETAGAAGTTGMAEAAETSSAQAETDMGAKCAVYPANAPAPQTRKPMCSMWDPIIAPSFDTEGRSRYLTWLKNRYQGDIRQLNADYGTHAASFEELHPEEYWFTLRWPDRTSFTEEEAAAMAPPFQVLAHNRLWQRDELTSYFRTMKERLHQIDPELWLCPDLAQWGYFLNVDGAMLSGVGMADLWDTAVRGIDLYHLAEHVDCANFLSVPVTPDGDADCYVTACHHSMLRSMNQGRDFLGGIYWGRFLYQPIYETLTPCEVMASIAASGASGCSAYGCCGLDDGGLLHRMEPYFNQSLARANQWFQEILPLRGELLPPETAILFPSAMALMENMGTPKNKERRLDLLGFYHACLDLGVNADVIDGKQLSQPDILAQYRVIILPEDDCYQADPDPELEKALAQYVQSGGTIIHSPGSILGRKLFAPDAKKHPASPVRLLACSPADFDGTDYTLEKNCAPRKDYTPRKDFLPEEDCIPQSTCFFSYKEEPSPSLSPCASVPSARRVLAIWLSDGQPALVKTAIGKGCVFSFGFDYGFSYTAKIAPHVPREQKNNALYPVTMLERNLLQELLEEALGRRLFCHRNIEKALFDKGLIIINHTSYPCPVTETGEKYYQYPAKDGTGQEILLPHSGVFIRMAENLA